MNAKYLKKYHLYDNNVFVGSFTADEICNITGCSKKIISGYSDDGRAYKFRYVFERIDDDELFYEEWENARFAILNAKVESKKIIVKKPFSIWKESKKRLRKYVNK